MENNENSGGVTDLFESFNRHYTDYVERYSTVRRVKDTEPETKQEEAESEPATLAAPVEETIPETSENENGFDEDEFYFTPEEYTSDDLDDESEGLAPVEPEALLDAEDTEEDETADASPVEDESVEDAAPVEEEVPTFEIVTDVETEEEPAPAEEESHDDGVEAEGLAVLSDEEEESAPAAPVEPHALAEEEEDFFFDPEAAVSLDEEEEDELGFYEPEQVQETPTPAEPEPETEPEPEPAPKVVEREIVREVIVVDRDQARDLGYAATSESGNQPRPPAAPAAPSAPVFPPSPSFTTPAPTPSPVARPVENEYDDYNRPPVKITSRPAEKTGFLNKLLGRNKAAEVATYTDEVNRYKENSRLREEGGVEEEFYGGDDDKDKIISLRTQENYDPREERRRLMHVTEEQRDVDPAVWLEQTMLDALKLDASDLHIVVDGETRDLRARIRVDGQMRDFDYVTGVPARVIMGRLKAATKLSSAGSYAPEETIYTLQLNGEARKARAVLFRVEDGGEALVMRLPLTGGLKQLDELDFSEKNLQLVYDLLAMPYKLIMIAGPMGSGKGSPAWERILTPKGWTTYGEIKVGDFVVGSDGKPTEVTGVFPRGVLDVFKVSFNDGSSVTVDGDHLWAVQSPDDRAAGNGFRTMETRELASKPLRNPKSNNGHKWFIPVVEPVQFAKQESPLPVHPYVLGALLGDGTFNGRGVSFSTVDQEFVVHLTGFLPEGVSLRLLDEAPSRAGKCPHYNVVGDGKKNELLCTFREMGLLGKRSVEKFIPEAYLYASVEERLELLRGLMDSDGHAAKAGRAEFTSVSKNLAEGVVFIARSLGGVATMTERTTSYTDSEGEKVKGQLSYRVSVKLPAEFNPFRLSRKADAWVAPTKYPVARAITSIEPAGQDEVICIQVDAENSLYVADHFLVTHNTTTAHGALLRVADAARTVWTIEDPVERRLPNLVQLEVDEDNGAGFDVLLGKLLRADYNTLFLGEIRDHPTAAAAVRQAKAGRQVMSTIHADDNIKSLMRLTELAGDSPMSVLSAVGGVISQRLVRRLNPNWDGKDPKTKYKGRAPIHEILFVDDNLVEVMMQDRPLSQIKQAVRKAKGSTFAEDAERLISLGVTDREEIVRVIGEYDAEDRY